MESEDKRMAEMDGDVTPMFADNGEDDDDDEFEFEFEFELEFEVKVGVAVGLLGAGNSSGVLFALGFAGVSSESRLEKRSYGTGLWFTVEKFHCAATQASRTTRFLLIVSLS